MKHRKKRYNPYKDKEYVRYVLNEKYQQKENKVFKFFYFVFIAIILIAAIKYSLNL